MHPGFRGPDLVFDAIMQYALKHPYGYVTLYATKVNHGTGDYLKDLCRISVIQHVAGAGPPPNTTWGLVEWV